MRVLSIGNSFSMDAHSWLHQIAQSYGDEIYAVNLYIGGCSLARHYNNLLSGEQAYEMWINGAFQRKSSLQEALQESWDVITLQQVSHMSGLPETYEPYLTTLYNAVKEACPNSTVLFHKTWAYELDSDHGLFTNYNRDQKEMYCKICETVAQVAAKYGCGVIPVGDVIQYMREHIPEFDYAKGGLSLNRDGFHLSYTYGRYAAALTWYAVLTGKIPEDVRFLPEWEEEKADPILLQKIHAAVNAIIRK